MVHDERDSVHFVEVDGASMPLMELSLRNGFASSST